MKDGKIIQNKVQTNISYKVPQSEDYITGEEYGFNDEGQLLIAENSTRFERVPNYDAKTFNSSIMKVFDIQNDGKVNLVREKAIDKYEVAIKKSVRNSYFLIALQEIKYSKGNNVLNENDLDFPLQIVDSKFNVLHEYQNLWNSGSDVYSTDLKKNILFYGDGGYTKFYDLKKKEFVTKPNKFGYFINIDNGHQKAIKGTDNGFYILFDDFYNKNKNRYELAYYKYKENSAELVASCFVESKFDESAQSILSLQKDTINLTRIDEGNVEKFEFPRID